MGLVILAQNMALEIESCQKNGLQLHQFYRCFCLPWVGSSTVALPVKKAFILAGKQQ